MLIITIKSFCGCKRYWLLLISFVCLHPGFSQVKTENHDIVLKDENLAIKPAGFYIARVNDHREDKTAVAWMVPEKLTPNARKSTLPVDFKGGSINTITRFINNTIPKNDAYHKIAINLQKFDDTEALTANGQVEGHVVLSFSFALEADGEKDIPLGTYNSSTEYHRTVGSAQDIEPTLRHMLQNGLVYINNWMLKQAGTNIYLAEMVNLSFTDFEDKVENDTVYYSVNRPLNWGDFQSNTPISRFDAVVFASIGYTEEVKLENSIINVLLSMKVFLPKSACWVKDISRNDYTLNHEQRHFDIAKIIAERFKRKLKTEKLPIANYDGIINVDYLDAYREMDAMQKQYDDETSHGTNHSAQQVWNDKIDAELKQFGVK